MKKNWIEKLGHFIGVASAILIAIFIFGVVLICGIKLLAWLWFM